ncbi:hypothetical protein B808_392 [Fructilactobacillus florum 8D]|uniref:Uncharacterized protein n=3 Tax=Fructilactobacillus florum TaxID=640331 RepID=W9EI94_9LACO|nr:hypothetical protein B807_116 [Fructilactobacillus florum 2F]ETO40730.1 hypothetical protein B808_392 [Fructilactobacillus florum 8D]KRM89884.1 hypothetical protein FC87_GL000299 [Fructilactobacillus florum DSM 22689 = JCM 16035]
MIIARICYLIALGTGLLLLGGAYAAAPVLTIIKVVAALLLIVVIELAFAWRLHHRLNKMWIYLTLFLLLLVGFMGIYLAGGYPF